MCMNCVCQKNPSFQPAAVSMCFHNVHPCGPSELKFLQATSYCPSQRLLYVCCKSCFKSRLCTCSRTGKPKLGTWGKSRPLSVRKELQKLFRTVHTKDSKAWYHLSMLDEILSALFRILVNMFVLEQENRLTLGSADCRGKILTDRLQSCRLSNKD